MIIYRIERGRPERREAVARWLAVLDDVAGDRRMLDHVGIVALVHAAHPAARMAAGEIAAEKLELLLGRPWLTGGHLQVRVALQLLALARVGLEVRIYSVVLVLLSISPFSLFNSE